MIAYIDKLGSCAKCGKNIELLIDGRAQTWRHPGLVPNPQHDAVPDQTTIREASK